MISRLPTVPEEAQAAQQQQSLSWGYLENSLPDQNQELVNNQNMNFIKHFFRDWPIPILISALCLIIGIGRY